MIAKCLINHRIIQFSNQNLMKRFGRHAVSSALSLLLSNYSMVLSYIRLTRMKFGLNSKAINCDNCRKCWPSDGRSALNVATVPTVGNSELGFARLPLRCDSRFCQLSNAIKSTQLSLRQKSKDFEHSLTSRIFSSTALSYCEVKLIIR